MLDFLKKMIDFRDRELTVILMDDEEPESSNSYRFRPRQLLGLFYLSLGLTAAILLLLVIFTPLGSLVYDKEDEELRESVIEISKRITSLQDSLRARNRQLLEIQKVLAEGDDTTFAISNSLQSTPYENADGTGWEPFGESEVDAYEAISRNEIIFSGILKESPSFPAPFPVEGTFTRGFNQETGHLGIDIASKESEVFRAIADGTVINHDWTINFGYVLHIQHKDGIVSIYKHASSLSKEVGDVVLKGDILGTVGNTGVLSSGPHLHMEIWRNGVPQNPLMYLVKS
ncbi:MAG: M23 family metallopeptidase [Balneolaceae bacterium]|nr:M23 family metallopeptidase [Balneolaceae bacterium]